MTVCVATICLWVDPNAPLKVPVVVLAADRMLTGGDLQYEPAQPKILPLDNRRIMVMIAGDAAVHAEVFARAKKRVLQQKTITVPDAAQIYADELTAYRNRSAEKLFLAPLGLTLESFLAQQKQLSPDVVGEVASQLRRHHLDAEAILAGCDSDGPHLYTIRSHGAVECQDYVGFASIGIGAPHAQSYLMLASYGRDWEFPKALRTTYSAKRRAEVAPGVGHSTDIFYADTTQFWILFPELVAMLKEVDDEIQSATAVSTTSADTKITTHLIERLRKATTNK